MDFNLTEDQKLIRDMVREFAENELAELAVELDANAEFPKAVLKKMAELGLLGLTAPEKYSGGEMDIISVLIAIEELAKACASTATIFALHNLVVSDAIARFGTEEQKKKHLTKLATGKSIGSIGLMEPDTEKVFSDLELAASHNGDGYILNGEKRMLIGGDNADLFLVFAKSVENDIEIFIVEKGTDGFTFDSDEDTLGLRATKTNTAKFENCALPTENLLGDETKQVYYFKEIYEIGKLAISAVAVGIAQNALKQSIEHSLQRKQFDTLISEFEGLRWMMAQMESDIVNARNSLYYAASLKAEGKSAEKECAIAKMTASRMATKVTIDAIQIRGGYGYMKDYPIERLFRDAKATEFVMGTVATQKSIIAGKILGK